MEYSLENISGIGKATAERLKAAGLDSVQKLASLKLEDLINLKIKGIGAATAKKYIDNAKKVLEESSPKEALSEKSEQLNVEIKQEIKEEIEKEEVISEDIEKEETISEEIEKEKAISEEFQKEEKEVIEEEKITEVVEEKEEEIPEPFDQDVENLKVLLKQQAECNIGTVGHVDHGMIMSFRHFP